MTFGPRCFIIFIYFHFDKSELCIVMFDSILAHTQKIHLHDLTSSRAASLMEVVANCNDVLHKSIACYRSRLSTRKITITSLQIHCKIYCRQSAICIKSHMNYQQNWYINICHVDSIEFQSHQQCTLVGLLSTIPPSTLPLISNGKPECSWSKSTLHEQAASTLARFCVLKSVRFSFSGSLFVQ